MGAMRDIAPDERRRHGPKDAPPRRGRLERRSRSMWGLSIRPRANQRAETIQSGAISIRPAARSLWRKADSGYSSRGIGAWGARG